MEIPKRTCCRILQKIILENYKEMDNQNISGPMVEGIFTACSQFIHFSNTCSLFAGISGMNVGFCRVLRVHFCFLPKTYDFMTIKINMIHLRLSVLTN